MSRTVPLVTGREWSVSRSSLCAVLSSPGVVEADDGMITLNVYRYDGRTSHRHPEHDGRRFRTHEEADAYCLTHGLLFPYVGQFATPEQAQAAQELATAHNTHTVR